jgi:hypothetical protein
VKFADGLATLQDKPGGVVIGSWVKHLWIQEDAWGNCTGYAS